MCGRLMARQGGPQRDEQELEGPSAGRKPRADWSYQAVRRTQADDVADFIQTHPEYGFTSVAGFFQEAGRRMLTELSRDAQYRAEVRRAAEAARDDAIDPNLD